MGTDFLYTEPSFCGGMALSIDLGATSTGQYNRSSTPNEADCRAIRSDWAVTAMDLVEAIESVKEDAKK
ncbi:MAG: hypothetical protein K8R02_03095 [Anaerohalosphaeraceae bacterium]|nr:hypothetical protein [Anaerohalosphaeraceae bacterium]